MTGKFLRRSAGFLISAASIVTATVLACAGGDWDGQEGSMFTPQIINQPQYMPFFRTTAYPFYDGYDNRGAEQFRQENSKEWLTYLGSGTSLEAMNYWLYEASINQVDSMIFDLKKKPANLSEKSKVYSLKAVPAEKANSFLYYLGYAKRNETFAAVEISSWGEKQVPANVASVEKQIAGGVSFLNKAKDPFMKQRHAFQLLRNYFFAGDYEKAIAIYDANETYFTASGNNLKWRALSYKAGAYYRQKDFAKANYLFSKVFDGCDALKRSAYLCFRPQEEKDWQQSLALAKTAREKQILWQLLGLHHDPVRAMKEILALDAKSDLANILLVRAVNMEEEKYESSLRMDQLNSPSKIPGTMSKELRVFLDEMSEKYAGNNPDLWHMAAAYINYIQLNYAPGDKQLKRVDPSSQGPLQNMQYHMVSLVGKMGRLKALDTKTEKDLLPDLKVIMDVRNTASDMRVHSAREWVRQMLAVYAEKAGEKEKAELISPSTATLALNTTEQIDKMLAYFDKPNPSEFELLFFQNNLLSKSDYLELKAIRFAQQDKLEDALKTFKSIAGHNRSLDANPFTIHIRDCHECDFAAPQKVKYNSISFMEKMIEMKNIAKANPKEAAQNYFLVANGFYNMTHFGNARLFYAMNRVNDSFYYYDITSIPGNKGDIALNYYLLALKNATDKEFRAKCTFMAAKCELNTYYYSRLETAPEDFRAGVYFASLQKEFSDTKYYKEVIKECGYFRTYLAQR